MPDTSEPKELIEGCQKQNPLSQKALYELYKDEMFMVCLRYSRNRQSAEDNLQESFIKIFDHIQEFKGNGYFKNWVKKVIINTCLMKLRKKNRLVFYENVENAAYGQEEVFPEPEYHYTMDELKRVIQQMPEGYKLIFTLYAYDNYTHLEIADMLKISENTSKSQLSRARNYLRNALKQLEHSKQSEVKRVIKSGLIGGLSLAVQEIV